MTQLNQLVAIEAGVKSTAERDLTAAYQTLDKDVLFSGLSRTYAPRDEEGEQLPPESTRVQLQVESLIAALIGPVSRYWDVTLTKDENNTQARADVVVTSAGQQVTLIENAPVTFLIWLEKRLVDLRTFISKLPTLDAAEEWLPSTDGGYQSTPTQTTRSVKVPRPFVKYEATVQHPAQVETYTENVVVGDWTLVKFSGKIPGIRKAELNARVEALIIAVKVAREGANTHEVTDRQAARLVLEYLFA